MIHVQTRGKCVVIRAVLATVCLVLAACSVLNYIIGWSFLHAPLVYTIMHPLPLFFLWLWVVLTKYDDTHYGMFVLVALLSFTIADVMDVFNLVVASSAFHLLGVLIWLACLVHNTHFKKDIRKCGMLLAYIFVVCMSIPAWLLLSRAMPDMILDKLAFTALCMVFVHAILLRRTLLFEKHIGTTMVYAAIAMFCASCLHIQFSLNPADTLFHRLGSVLPYWLATFLLALSAVMRKARPSFFYIHQFDEPIVF